jgi:hypothetical protein
LGSVDSKKRLGALHVAVNPMKIIGSLFVNF